MAPNITGIYVSWVKQLHEGTTSTKIYYNYIVFLKMRPDPAFERKCK